MKVRIKESLLAGSWYPAGKTALAQTVDQLLHEAPKLELADLAGLVAPHAGYRYSGRAAALAYRQLQGQGYRRAVIIAPSHFVGFSGAALPPIDLLRTPLGDVRVDTDATGELASRPGFRFDPAPFREEHSLEIQLPFLQTVLPEATLVPVVAGRMRRDQIMAAADELASLADAETVFIASSDFVHYGRRFGFVPFPAHGPEQLRRALAKLDGGAIAAIVSGQLDRFLDYVSATGATICGRIPIGILMALVGPEGRGRELCYYTSLDVTWDWTSTVSYAASDFERGALV